MALYLPDITLETVRQWKNACKFWRKWLCNSKLKSTVDVSPLKFSCDEFFLRKPLKEVLHQNKG